MLAGLEAKTLFQHPGHRREPGHAADQKDFIETRNALALGGRNGSLGHRHGALKQLGGQILDLGPGEFHLGDLAAEAHDVPPGLGGAQFPFQPLRGNEQILHEQRVVFRMGARGEPL